MMRQNNSTNAAPLASEHGDIVLIGNCDTIMMTIPTKSSGAGSDPDPDSPSGDALLSAGSTLAPSLCAPTLKEPVPLLSQTNLETEAQTPWGQAKQEEPELENKNPSGLAEPLATPGRLNVEELLKNDSSTVIEPTSDPDLDFDRSGVRNVRISDPSSSQGSPSGMEEDEAAAKDASNNMANPSNTTTTMIMNTDNVDEVFQDKKLASPSTMAALEQKSEFKLTTTQLVMKRRSGWGTPIGLGLRGGADTLSNGTSGWGPPPSNSNNANTGSNDAGTSGWGSAPPPNPSASAAWGSIGGSTSNDEVPSNAASNNAIGSKPQSQQPPSTAPTLPPPSSGTQPTTSWAAAAGKGLPTTENNNPNGNNYNGSSSSVSAKQLEHLNSVREALLSPNGWGGSNVNQDTSWDTDSRSNGQEASGNAASSASGSKDGNSGNNGNTWNGGSSHRNDGTDLWKSTLYGESNAAPKPQPSNPWGASPSDPTDYKRWGEEDDVAAKNSGSANDSFWRPEQQPNQFKKQDGWNADSRAPTGWNNDTSIGSRESMPPPSHNDPPNNNGGWGQGPPGPQRTSSNSGWGNGPQAPNRWGDHNSPPIQRRHMDDGGAASHWGSGRPNMNGPNVPGNAGGWKDMPIPDMGGPRMALGPPGPPGPRGGMMNQNGPMKEPWGQPVRSGWGDDTQASKGSWGDDNMKKDGGSTGGWGNKPWNETRNMQQPNIRTSPSGWDDGINTMGDGPGWGNKNDKGKEVIWNSKPFRILCDMGFRKDDVENALRASNLRLDDALEMLNSSSRRGMSNTLDTFNSDVSYDPMRTSGGFPSGGGLDPISQNPLTSMNPGSAAPSGGSSLPLNPLPRGPAGLGNSSVAPNMMPPQPRQPSSQQPSAQQLRVLVHQIQMAVQAGHLNPQILNQPLAPQTLLLLNQLLQQIKQLHSLQQQHTLETRRSGGAGSQQLMNVTVNITKTKQHIQNLQNQISAQQANYLKTGPANIPNQTITSSGSQSETTTNTVQEMFHGINLMSGEGQSSSNGSRLYQWKKEFPKAPGSGPSKPGAGPANGQTSTGNMLLENSPWSKGSDANGGWPESNKANTGASDFGIPEFEPGKPWKGTSLKNPDEDPNLTPGSVATMSINSLTKATSSATSMASNDNSALGFTSPTSTWSFGNAKSDLQPKSTTSSSWLNTSSSSVVSSASGSTLTHMGQGLWGSKTSSSGGRMPNGPPGLSGSTGNNSGGWPQSNNGWSTGNDSSSSNANSSSVISASGGSPWLLLRNLTPQIGGSTLKTLCMQHGPLQHFDLYLNHNIALVMYASHREAAKAQKALHNCLLGNTTIHANMTSEGDISNILQQLGVSGGSTSNQNSTSNSVVSSSSVSKPASDVWNEITSVATTAPSSGSSLFPTSGSVWSVPEHPSSLHLLPGDLVDNM